MRKIKVMSKYILILLALIAFALFLNWGNKSLVTTYYEYPIKSSGAAEAFDGYRITQISDLQSEYFGENQKNLAEAAEKTHPDIIVYTGDLIDRNHTDYQAARTAMEKLISIAPVYYINGNHELKLNEKEISSFYDELRAMGVHILFDEEALIEKDGSKMHLIGLSEFTLSASKVADNRINTEFEPSVIIDMMDKLTKHIDEEEFVVMLAHEPQFLKTYAEGGNGKVDLVFAGHAHGGQIRLPFTEGLFAPGQGAMPKLTSGMHKEGNTTMVISRGLGNSVFPYRIFNRPEIVVVDLKKEN